jgi:hypothetical protein
MGDAGIGSGIYNHSGKGALLFRLGRQKRVKRQYDENTEI